MAKPLFIFGSDTGVSSPAELKRLRSIAEALNGSDRVPQNIGEGLNAIGEALLYRSVEGKASKMEEEGEASAKSAMRPIYDALTGKTSPAFGGETVTSALSGEPKTVSTTTTGTTAPLFANDGTELGGYLSDETRRATLPAGMRNNNPGNIKFVGQKVPGIVGPSVNTDQGDPQAVFDTPESGMRAMYSLAKRKYDGGKRSTNQLIAGDMGWTPGNYQAAANVARNMGIGPDDDINMNDPAMASKFMQALILQEHGKKGSLYPQAMIDSVTGVGAPRQVASLDPSAGLPRAAAAIETQAPRSGYVDPAVKVVPPLAGSAPASMPPQGGAQPTSVPPQAAGSPPQTPASPVQQPSAGPQSAGLPPLPSRAVEAGPSVAGVSTPNGQPQQAAQSGPTLQQLYGVLQNKWLSPSDRALVASEIQRQQQLSDPAYQQQRQLQQLQMDKLRKEIGAPAKRETTTLNGRLIDSQTGQTITEVPDQIKPTSDQQNYEYYRDFESKNGRTPLGPLEWEQAQRKAGATSIQNNMGEGDKFYENLDKKNAETFAAMSDAGIAARSKIGQIDRLEGLFANVPQGIEGGLKKIAGDYGIAVGEGTSDIQAASALLEKMVPEQRAPGSGPMSDADIKMFRSSLPRIINQPGGNQLIFGTMRGIAQYEMQMGEIADQVADRVITPAEGRKRIRELKNPLEDFKIPEGGTPNEGWKELSPGVRIKRVGD